MPQTRPNHTVEIEGISQVSAGYNALTLLIDSIPALVASIDCNMTLRFCNKPFRQWFNIAGDVSGKFFPAITGKDFFYQVQRHLGTVLFGEPAHFQISINNAGRIQYLDATLSPEFDNENKVKGFIFHSSDVTEKNKTERALKDYFENASIGLHWVDAKGVVIWANPAELKMLGYAPHEYIGHHISEFHASRQGIEDILTRLTNKEQIKNYEASLICKDGRIKHVSINSSVMWEGEKFIHTRCFTVDITQERHALRAIEESEQRFRMIAQLAPLVIWTTDKSGACNFLSVKWQEQTGKEITEGLGTGWIDFIHPEDRDKIRLSWNQSFLKRLPFEAKARLINKNNQYTICLISTTPRYDTQNVFLGYVGIMQDIALHEDIKSSLEQMVVDRMEDIRKQHASLKRAEKDLLEKNQQLEASNRQLESFAHVASHDLQEPLRKISTFSGRLFELEGERFSEKGRQFYERIRETSNRMQRLIHDLLTYSKLSVKEDLEQEIDLNELFTEVISELEVKITDKGAMIQKSGLPKVYGIRFQFFQLFLNLVNNSLKFAKDHEPPVITIQYNIAAANSFSKLSSKEGQYHHISISDNGIGFDPSATEKIFEVFQRLNGRSQYEGSGIGLAICRRIIENHGGYIYAEGKPNEGATFHILLPVTPIKQKHDNQT